MPHSINAFGEPVLSSRRHNCHRHSTHDLSTRRAGYDAASASILSLVAGLSTPTRSISSNTEGSPGSPFLERLGQTPRRAVRASFLEPGSRPGCTTLSTSQATHPGFADKAASERYRDATESREGASSRASTECGLNFDLYLNLKSAGAWGAEAMETELLRAGGLRQGGRLVVLGRCLLLLLPPHSTPGDEQITQRSEIRWTEPVRGWTRNASRALFPRLFASGEAAGLGAGGTWGRPSSRRELGEAYRVADQWSPRSEAKVS
ncbi:unnamed protein product [Diplocarpon coronariae]